MGFLAVRGQDEQTHVPVHVVLRAYVSMCVQGDLTVLHCGEER